MQPHLKVGNGAIITDHLSIINHQLLIDRGYTSHEHFSEVGIIHMNGRLYDPLLRRFLNADENIQDPHNTQNYNKYGYVMNNPLMYNDPSGEFFFFGVLAAWLGSKLLAATIIGAVIGLASYTVGVLVSTGSLQSWNIGGALKATFFGAVGGAVTFGIGSIFQTSQGAFTALGSVLDKAGVLPLVQAGAHGISQGVLSLMQGGDFLSGAAAGFLGSLGASGFGIIAGEAANSAVGTIAFGALSGGIGAELTGGNFWQGAITGGIVAGLNHAMHMGDPPGRERRRFRQRENNRSRVGSGSLLFDARGQELLSHWLNGSGTDLSFTDGTWGSYMRDNSIIKDYLTTRATSEASYMSGSGRTSYSYASGNMNFEIQNGYLTGYEMLHGTNYFSYSVTGTYNASSNSYIFNYTVKWYDSINPNHSYGADTVFSKASNVFYSPKDYNISIIWHQSIIVKGR